MKSKKLLLSLVLACLSNVMASSSSLPESLEEKRHTLTLARQKRVDLEEPCEKAFHVRESAWQRSKALQEDLDAKRNALKLARQKKEAAQANRTAI